MKKGAAKKRAKEQREWEAARDEKLQDEMLFKEEIEDTCSDRIISENGEDIMILNGDYNLLHIWVFLAEYGSLIERLKQQIPNLEYDPRIAPDLKYAFRERSQRGLITSQLTQRLTSPPVAEAGSDVSLRKFYADRNTSVARHVEQISVGTSTIHSHESYLGLSID